MSTVQETLAARLDDKRVVVWHDPAGEYADQLDELCSALDAVAARVENNEFGIKYQVLRGDPQSRYLIYRTGEVPAGNANWLLDLELAYGVFKADRAAMVAQELGFTNPDQESVVEKYADFFANQKMVDQLARFVTPSDNAVLIQAKMCAVLLGQSDHTLKELVRSLLIENAAGKSAKYAQLQKYGLDEFFWGATTASNATYGVAQIYGFNPEQPNLTDFILWLFENASQLEQSAGDHAARNVKMDFELFRHTPGSREPLKTLAKRAAEDLDAKSMAASLTLDEISNNDTFPEFDQRVIALLAAGVAQRTIPDREVAETIQNRKNSLWFGDYINLYSAIECASELLARISTANLIVESIDDGLERYAAALFRIDQLYRQFLYFANNAEAQGDLLDEVRRTVEDVYLKDFVRPLGKNWQQIVNQIDRWRSATVTAQTSFYKSFVEKIIRNGRNKVAVIISDGLRFEVADQLASRIRQEDRYDAELTPTLGALPSFTQLGMAALLPHNKLSLAVATSADGKIRPLVVADGLPTNGLQNRAAIMANVGGTAIQAKDLLELDRDGMRALYQDNQVLYVYHDLIDAQGDKAVSERNTPQACEEAITEIIRVVKKLAAANANNFLITADHGFLYQDTEVPESYFLEAPTGEKFHSSRFAIGTQFDENPDFTKFSSQQLGLIGEAGVQIPNSIFRMRKSGAGKRYVHGGASLPEIVVPVVAVNKKRVSDVRPVEVEIVPTSDKLPTSQVSVRLFQVDPVDDKAQPRTLRAGIYGGEQLISNLVWLTFDFTSTDKRDRYETARLTLGQEADEFEGRSVEFRLEEPIKNSERFKVYAKQTYKLDRVHTRDFDF